MLCEHYKDALIDAAATGVAPSGELRAHLDACASCRAAFDEERSLFSAIDSGLHASANAEVPASLLPRARAQLDEAVAPRFRWVPSLVFASASVALALAVLLLAHTHHTAPEEVAKQAVPVLPSATASATKTNAEKISPEATQIAAIRVNQPRAARNSTNRPSAASSNPEVLVPPDEREAFVRFLRRGQEPPVLNSVSAEWVPKAPQESVEILPVEITSLKVKPLNKDEDQDQESKSQIR